MLKQAFSAAVVAASISTSHAGAIDFRIGSSVAELTYLTQTASFGYGGADIGFGILGNDDNDFLMNASMLVSGNSTGDVKGLHFGVGLKAFAGIIDDPNNNENGAAVAIGGKVRYVFPGSAPLAVLGEVYFAPSITSFADFDGVNEFRIALEYEVTPSARAYIGYRKLEVELDDRSDRDVDNGGHVGVRFEF